MASNNSSAIEPSLPPDAILMSSSRFVQFQSNRLKPAQPGLFPAVTFLCDVVTTGPVTNCHVQVSNGHE